MKLWERKRLSTVIRRIYEQFDQSGVLKRRRPIKAKIALAAVPGSYSTILKARKALQIETKMIAGKHSWLPPKRTLDEALASIGAKRRNTEDNFARCVRIAVATLTDIFEQFGHDLTAAQAKQFLQENHVSRNHKVIAAAKKQLDVSIIPAKLAGDGHWHWVWGGPAVQEWLTDLMKNKDHKEEYIFQCAQEKQWSRLAVRDAAMRVGGFKRERREGVWWWHDINMKSGGSNTEAVEIETADSPGATLTSVSDEPAQDWMHPTVGERAQRWRDLRKKSVKDVQIRETFDRYQDQMKVRYPDEYAVLMRSQSKRSSLQVEVEELKKLVTDLQEKMASTA